ncbi:hypothetical protein [Streptomyces clavifer]|uniref:hypothetical protein n=1 Tax=Streptomyces clavifer TaxID=68188 RepID=UPI00365C4033
MTGIYALIDPDGQLEFCKGVPDQMLGSSDPQHGTPAAFTIQPAVLGINGLQGHIINGSCLVRAYRPNRIATAVVTALGGPQEYIFGNVTVCGSQNALVGEERPYLCGLTDAQQDLIWDIHTAISKEASTRQ